MCVCTCVHAHTHTLSYYIQYIINFLCLEQTNKQNPGSETKSSGNSKKVSLPDTPIRCKISHGFVVPKDMKETGVKVRPALLLLAGFLLWRQYTLFVACLVSCYKNFHKFLHMRCIILNIKEV